MRYESDASRLLWALPDQSGIQLLSCTTRTVHIIQHLYRGDTFEDFNNYVSTKPIS